MVVYYWDTSALLKKYINEVASSRVREVLFKAQNMMLTSKFTELEIYSALERLKKMKQLQSPDYRQIFHDIEKDFFKGVWSIVSICNEHIEKSKKILRQRSLRVGDSLQLSAALISSKQFQNFTFCSADHKLLEAARLEGLKCMDFSND